MTAVQYVGDDGTTYQIDQPASYSDSGAGNLPPATGSEPLFPALNNPRHFVGKPLFGGGAKYVHVCCDMFNGVFLLGPGAPFTIGPDAYVVTICLGETRPDI